MTGSARALLAALVVALAAAACTTTSDPDTGSTDEQTTVGSDPAADESTTTTHADPEPDPMACPTWTLDRPFGAVADPALTEISGAVVSPTHPDRIWVHEDSGAEPVIHLLTLDGAREASWRLDGVDAVDWEDIAAVSTPPSLFVGDIGDNRRARDTVAIHRLDEPPGDGSGPPAATFHLRLPAAADAEALLVDPRHGDVVLVTKSLSGDAEVLVAAGAADTDNGATIDVAAAGILPFGLLAPVLAGDVADDGSAVALRTPSQVLWWPVLDDESLAEALLAREPCILPSITDPYGEALALLPDRGGYVLLGEGQHPPLVTAG